MLDVTIPSCLHGQFPEDRPICSSLPSLQYSLVLILICKADILLHMDFSDTLSHLRLGRRTLHTFYEGDPERYDQKSFIRKLLYQCPLGGCLGHSRGLILSIDFLECPEMTSGCPCGPVPPSSSPSF
jgi:hypothetical protein